MTKTAIRTDRLDAEEIHDLFERARAHGFDSLGVGHEDPVSELLEAAQNAELRFFADASTPNLVEWGRALYTLCSLQAESRSFYESIVDYKAVYHEVPDPRPSRRGGLRDTSGDQLRSESLAGLSRDEIRVRFEKHLGSEVIAVLGLDEVHARWTKAKLRLLGD